MAAPSRGIDAEMMGIFHSLGLGGHWFDAMIYARSYSWHGSADEELRTCARGRPEWKCQVAGCAAYQHTRESCQTRSSLRLPPSSIGWEVIENRQHGIISN